MSIATTALAAPARATARQQYAAVLPGRLAHTQPTTQVYIRRRLLVLAVLVAVVVGVWLGAGSVRATRGGEPAAPSTGRSAVTAQVVTYMVHPGDTLWSIAAKYHGSADQADYVDALVQRNGGTVVQVGQVLTLP
jgi:nucleoid-associated protein YgaU